MIKQLEQYAKSKNLVVDKKKNLVYGDIGGRFLTIWQTVANNASSHGVKIWATTDDILLSDSVSKFLDGMRLKYSYIKNISYDGKVIEVLFQSVGINWAKKYIEQLDGFLNETLLFCSQNQFGLGCEVCRMPEELSLIQLNLVPHLICPECSKQVTTQAMRHKQEFLSQGQGNVGLGLLGALGGALIGSIVWILLYQAGYIAVVGAMAIVVCTFKGYELLGAHMTKFGVAVCSVISVVGLVTAEWISLLIMVNREMSDYIGLNLMESNTILVNLFEYPDFIGGVARDMVLGLICVIAYAVVIGVNTYKERIGAVDTKVIAKITGRQ